MRYLESKNKFDVSVQKSIIKTDEDVSFFKRIFLFLSTERSVLEIYFFIHSQTLHKKAFFFIFYFFISMEKNTPISVSDSEKITDTQEKSIEQKNTQTPVQKVVDSIQYDVIEAALKGDSPW